MLDSPHLWAQWHWEISSSRRSDQRYVKDAQQLQFD